MEPVTELETVRKHVLIQTCVATASNLDTKQSIVLSHDLLKVSSVDVAAKWVTSAVTVQTVNRNLWHATIVVKKVTRLRIATSLEPLLVVIVARMVIRRESVKSLETQQTSLAATVRRQATSAEIVQSLKIGPRFNAVTVENVRFFPLY